MDKQLEQGRAHLTYLMTEVEHLVTGTPIHAELESDHEGTDILLQWDTSLVYAEEDLDFFITFSVLRGKIDRTELAELLHEVYKVVEQKHTGYVERGTSDIDEGVYRIRLHKD